MGILVLGLELKATKRIREFGGVTQVWRWMVLGLSQALSVAVSVALLSVQNFRDSLLVKHT